LAPRDLNLRAKEEHTPGPKPTPSGQPGVISTVKDKIKFFV